MIKYQIKIPLQPKIKRSSHWSALRKKWLKLNPTCAACGKRVSISIHHIIPLHIDKTKELDETNLITLCQNTRSTFCHYTFGHLGISWWKYDPNIINNAAIILQMKQNVQG